MNNGDISKTGQFFVRMGKKYRFLLPVAVVGLALTMLWSSLINYIKISGKRFVCVAFLIMLFLLANSFLFSVININLGGGIKDNDDVGEIEISEKEDAAELVPSDTYSLEDILEEGNSLEKEEVVSKEQETAGTALFSAEDPLLILVNKQHPIPENYEFRLGKLSGNMQCDERIINDLLLMMTAADEEGIKLVICSPYRADEKQEKLFNRKIDDYMGKGYSYMEAYKLSGQAVTVPGASEHQIGLALDIVSNKYSLLEEGFGKTEAGIWLQKNCARFGFVLRYPKGKEDITGIEYEPWHFRYVGKEAADIIMSEGISLEEFWEKYM